MSCSALTFASQTCCLVPRACFAIAWCIKAWNLSATNCAATMAGSSGSWQCWKKRRGWPAQEMAKLFGLDIVSACVRKSPPKNQHRSHPHYYQCNLPWFTMQKRWLHRPVIGVWLSVLRGELHWFSSGCSTGKPCRIISPARSKPFLTRTSRAHSWAAEGFFERYRGVVVFGTCW